MPVQSPIVAVGDVGGAAESVSEVELRPVEVGATRGVTDVTGAVVDGELGTNPVVDENCGVVRDVDLDP